MESVTQTLRQPSLAKGLGARQEGTGRGLEVKTARGCWLTCTGEPGRGPKPGSHPGAPGQAGQKQGNVRLNWGLRSPRGRGGGGCLHSLRKGQGFIMVTMSLNPCSCSCPVWNSPALDVSHSPTHTPFTGGSGGTVIALSVLPVPGLASSTCQAGLKVTLSIYFFHSPHPPAMGL